MITPVTIIIDGAPVAKGRPRLGMRGNVYTPLRTRSYETAVRQLAVLEMRGRPPIKAPVRIELLIEVPVPPSWSARKHAQAIAGTVRPTSRPDLDNYVKSLDALNGIVIVDDSQIVEMHARKKYSTAPKLIATVFPLDDAAVERQSAADRSRDA